MSQGSSILTGDVLVLVAMALFGSYPLFLRLFPDIPTLAFLLAFQVVGAVVFGLFQCLSERPPIKGKGWALLAGLALVASGNDLAYFFALRLTTVANAVLAHQMVSGFLVLLAPPLLREKTTGPEWIALVLSLSGVAVLYADRTGPIGLNDFAGISLGLASALLYALLIILYRRLNRRGLSIVTINCWRYLLSTVLLLPVLSMTGSWVPKLPDFAVLAAFGMLFAVVGSGIHTYALSRTRAMHVSILGKSEPVFAALYALLFLHEPLTSSGVWGGLLIIGSSLWLATIKHEPEAVESI